MNNRLQSLESWTQAYIVYLDSPACVRQSEQFDKYCIANRVCPHHPLHSPAGEDVPRVNETIQHLRCAFHHLLHINKRRVSEEGGITPLNVA